MAELITVATFLKSHEAHLARTLLEAEGVRAFVIGDQATDVNPLFTFYPGVSVRLQVLSSDFENAKEILERSHIMGAQNNFETCPECKSKDVKGYFSDHRTTLALGYIFAPLLIIAGLWRRKKRCLSCGHRWKSQ